MDRPDADPQRPAAGAEKTPACSQSRKRMQPELQAEAAGAASGSNSAHPGGQPEKPARAATATRAGGNDYPRGQQELPARDFPNAPADSPDDLYLRILKQYWGYDSFRGIQADIIRSIARGEDTLGLMPTGGGKSITFQVPALAREGLCLVVTPLIALMKDQVHNLRQRGIQALAIHAGMSRQDIVATLDNCIFGPYKFLYVSPERLDTDLFRAKLRRMRVSLIAVDESHCISQWGYDFRPSYLKIADIRALLPGVPVLALTASATPEVADDIQRRLGFARPNVFRMSFERKNLAYIVRHTTEKRDELLHILSRVPGSAIVYTRSRERTKEVATLLNAQGIAADYYHAGLDDAAKDQRQQRWQRGETRVIVATNAFGMGIDKPDVRLVVHIDLPDSIEAYFQEAGRAGRDGRKAYAVILYAPGDKAVVRQRVPGNFPDKDYILGVYEHLQYYYQMAMGDGLGCVREFDIDDFCRKFRYFPLPVDSALKILTLAGYLEYNPEADNASRLVFTIRRDELYRLREMEGEADLLIRALLRAYTGLFTDYAFISEELLATRTGLSRRRVYELLLHLSRLHIVHYIPRKKIPHILYTRARTDIAHIRIPPSAYEERRKSYEARLEAMLAYADNDTACRSRMLLRYFGEKSEHDCGHCDTCLELRSKQQAPSLPAHEIRHRILQALEGKKLTPAQVSHAVQTDKDMLADILHDLMDESILSCENGLLQIRDKTK